MADDDYSDLLQGGPQRQSRADILYNTLIPNYLKYQQPSPMPPPGTPLGKIGPPSGNPSLSEMVAKGLPDIASLAAPEAKLGAAALSKLSPSLAALFLSNPKYIGSGIRKHRIIDDNLNTVGKVSVAPEGTNLHVHGIDALSQNPQNAFGTSEVRSLLKALKDEYPEAETISGYRASGARRGPAAVPSDSPAFEKAADAKIRIRPPFEQRQAQEVERLMNDPKFQAIIKKNMGIE